MFPNAQRRVKSNEIAVLMYTKTTSLELSITLRVFPRIDGKCSQNVLFVFIAHP